MLQGEIDEQRDGRSEIFVMKLTDPSPKQLASGESHSQPIWNPDGDKIFYAGQGRIYSRVTNGSGGQESAYEGENILNIGDLLFEDS